MHTIEIAYASPDKQSLLTITVASPCTVKQAIIQSDILKRHPEIDFTINKVGIFNKVVGLDHLLSHNDRIEIYRPLLIDPKQARRIRAIKKLGSVDISTMLGVNH